MSAHPLAHQASATRTRVLEASVESHERFVAALLAELSADFEGLPTESADGLHSYDFARGSVRIAARRADGFFAIEVLPDTLSGAWEAFHLQLQDGSARCGWRRRGSDDTPPRSWRVAAAAAGLEAGDSSLPKAELSFQTLAAELLLASSPQAQRAFTVSTTDIEIRQALAEEARHWKDVARQQAGQLRQLRTSFALLGQTLPTPSEESLEPARRPEWSLTQLSTWAAENVGRIVILPRALAEARKSDYENPGLVFEAMEMLAGVYRDVRMGAAERSALLRRCEELHLFMGGSIDPSRAGEFGSEYFVNWSGRRRFLDQHIGRGTSRETRYTFRAYYTWDEADQVVVVGWLPSHLTNGIT